jgi:hypothetical protein
VAYVLLNGVYVAVNTIVRDGQTEVMELSNVSDPITALGMSVTGPGTSGAAAGAMQGIQNGVPLPVLPSNAATQADTIAANAGSPTILKGSPGVMCRAVVTAPGSAPLLFYNNTAGTSAGITLGYIPANAQPGETYDFFMPASLGISAPVQSGNPGVTVSFA